MVQGLLQRRDSGLKTTAGSNRVLNALTIDLEDYFMVSAFEPRVPKGGWGNYESRVDHNTDKILSILNEAGVNATFFAVGWLAEKYPALIKKIAAQGHEIACHGYFHELVYRMTPDQFRQDLRRCKQALEQAADVTVQGYRAPSFSITDKTPWAWGILEDEGFVYDASVLPAVHARGGIKGAERFPHRIGGLLEFPMSTLQVVGKSLPFSGGGYFRLFPYIVTRYGFKQINGMGQPGVVYLHPWEFDPDQPRMPASRFDRWKHYVGLESTEIKFKKLLNEFSFASIRDVLRLPLPRSSKLYYC